MKQTSHATNAQRAGLIPENLASLCKMPKKNQVLGRYLYLYENYKSKDMRKRTLKKYVLGRNSTSLLFQILDFQRCLQI